MKDKQHGGKRPNSGAKPKYGETTKMVSFRIPESLIKEIKQMVYDYLKGKIK